MGSYGRMICGQTLKVEEQKIIKFHCPSTNEPIVCDPMCQIRKKSSLFGWHIESQLHIVLVMVPNREHWAQSIKLVNV